MATFTLTGNIDEQTGGDARRVTTVTVRSNTDLVDPGDDITYERETRVPVTAGAFSVTLPADDVLPLAFGFTVTAPQIGMSWVVPVQPPGATVDLSSFADPLPLPIPTDDAIVAGLIAAGVLTGEALDDAIAAALVAGDVVTGAALDAYTEPFVLEGELMNNVRDFGAVGDGVTNDTAAVQAAIDAGGTTYFPTGIYKVTSLNCPNLGMNLLGASMHGPTLDGLQMARLRTATGDLLVSHANGTGQFTIRGLFLESVSGGGHIMQGKWAAGVISASNLVQNNAGKSAVNASMWLMMTTHEETQFTHLVSATVPTVNLISPDGNIAHFHFEDCWFNNTGNYGLWIESTLGYISMSGRIINCNFEDPRGGGIKILTGRQIVIENCGFWDMHVEGASRNLIHIGNSATVDAQTSREITIRNFVRDASLNPLGGIYDIFVDTNTTKGLYLETINHQKDVSILVGCGGSTGRIVNSPALTLSGHVNMSTETWQTYAGAGPTGTGTAVGNGTVVSKYRRDGNTVFVQLKFTLGSTSTVGSGGMTFALPIAGVSGGYCNIAGFYDDVSTGQTWRGSGLFVGGGTGVLAMTNANPVVTAVAAAPFTWAVGDIIELNGSYQVPT